MTKLCNDIGNSKGKEIKDSPPLWNTGGNRPIILFDMDDVVTNFISHLIKIYNQRTGSNVNPKDIKTWDLSDYCTPEVFKIFQEDGFFLNVPIKKESTSTLKRLIDSTKYDIYIITACTRPEELAEKVKWFNKILPDFNPNRIISIREKHLIRGDLIVDDKVDNLDLCSPFMKCVVFDMPSNRNNNEYMRIHNLREIEPILENLFYPVN